MHLKMDIDIMEFLKKVGQCENSIYYETLEGDTLNLSSTLSQFIFCTIAAKPHYWKTGIIRCNDPSDYEMLKDYLTKDE